MALDRKVGFFQGLKYQGGGPMVAWMLHRITGVGILVVVGVHVLSSFFMQQTGSNAATFINTIYEHWAFQVVVAFFVLFHSLNGLRISILDIWPKLLNYQREALWLQWFIFVPVYGLIVFVLVQHGLAGG
jgi:succinate dehydrogenase / fumarate reductase cytochrome b subunit